MKSKTICFCIPRRKHKDEKHGSPKPRRNRKSRGLSSTVAGDHVEGNHHGNSNTTSYDGAGMAAVMMTAAATHAVDGGGSGHGGDGGGSAHGGGDGGGG